MSEKSFFDPNGLVVPKFIGVPYKLHGRTFSGADCIGLCMLYLKDLGIDYSDMDVKNKLELRHWYEKTPSRFVNTMLEIGSLVKFADLRKFDLLLFFSSQEESKYPTGMGIMVDERHFLTVLRDGDGSAIHMLNVYWKSIFWGGLRLHRVVEAGFSKWE